jgi:hypothetical protein
MKENLGTSTTSIFSEQLSLNVQVIASIGPISGANKEIHRYTLDEGLLHLSPIPQSEPAKSEYLA